MLRTACLFILVSLPATAALGAESFYDRHFAPPCYARTYDAAHLAAHPRQRLTRFYVTGSRAGNVATESSFVIDFGFMVKGSGDIFYGSASCDSIPGNARCWADGDAGTFALESADDGLRVDIGDHLTLEGHTGFSPDLGQGGNDKVLRLHRAPAAACRFG